MTKLQNVIKDRQQQQLAKRNSNIPSTIFHFQFASVVFDERRSQLCFWCGVAVGGKWRGSMNGGHRESFYHTRKKNLSSYTIAVVIIISTFPLLFCAWNVCLLVPPRVRRKKVYSAVFGVVLSLFDELFFSSREEGRRIPF